MSDTPNPSISTPGHREPRGAPPPVSAPEMPIKRRSSAEQGVLGFMVRASGDGI